MKKLDITAITNSSRLPIKKGTLQFLQDAPKEIVASVVTSLIGPAYSSSVVYILAGGINSGTYPVYNITAGKAFYNGEIYDLQAASFTATGSNVAVFSFLQTQYTTDADPVTFTDSVIRNIHNITTLQLTQGVSGSGLANYLQGFFLSFQIPAKLNLLAPIVSPYTDNISQIIGAYPDLLIYTPAPIVNLFPVLLAGTLAVGDVSPTGSSFSVTFATALPAGSYGMFGSILSSGTFANDACVTWAYNNITNTGFNIYFQEHRGVAQNISFKYYIVKL